MTDLSVLLFRLYRAFLNMQQIWQHIFADNVLSNCNLWKLTVFPYKLSIVPYYLPWPRKENKVLICPFFVKQSSFIQNFSGFWLLLRCHEVDLNISTGNHCIVLNKQHKHMPRVVCMGFTGTVCKQHPRKRQHYSVPTPSSSSPLTDGLTAAEQWVHTWGSAAGMV